MVVFFKNDKIDIRNKKIKYLLFCEKITFERIVIKGGYTTKEDMSDRWYESDMEIFLLNTNEHFIVKGKSKGIIDL